ncbi:hypothetical protein L1887_48072 [Cichorium endivia]|nr:hypothetical protein L1887_48072 [Cichorium endivia]
MEQEHVEGRLARPLAFIKGMRATGWSCSRAADANWTNRNRQQPRWLWAGGGGGGGGGGELGVGHFGWGGGRKGGHGPATARATARQRSERVCATETDDGVDGHLDREAKGASGFQVLSELQLHHRRTRIACRPTRLEEQLGGRHRQPRGRAGGQADFEAMDLDAAELLLQLQLQTVLFAAGRGRDSRATVARRLERHVPGVLACAEGCALAALADLAVEIDE